MSVNWGSIRGGTRERLQAYPVAVAGILVLVALALECFKR